MRTGVRIQKVPNPAHGPGQGIPIQFDSLFPRSLYLFLGLWKLLTRTNVFVWRSYLPQSPPGVFFLYLSNQAFLCCLSHPSRLCKRWSLVSWTECKSYSVISVSLRATDQRKQKLH